ncbi:restriction endonuclease subunit S [Nocardia sp. NPDC004568]|uniref:restriction endonuclease subunit S n=1 Tax=Nocardia sp. NPDC004568 TaxID=3154551 RepID=UPI0033A71CDC
MAIRRVFRVVNGGTPTADAENWGGAIPWATPVDFGETLTELTATRRTLTARGVKSGSVSVPAGSILVSTRAPIGYVALAGREIAFNQGCKALVPTRAIVSRFFAYQIESLRTELRSRGFGATFTELSSENLASVSITVPDVEEQRRIADFLDAETAQIDMQAAKLNQFDSQLVEREGAVLQDLLGCDAVAPGNALPDGWRWTPLQHLTDPVRPIMYGIVLPGPNVDDGVPIVKGGDVAGRRLSVEKLNKTTREIESRYTRSRLKGGDLVIAIRGSVGEVEFVPNELSGANLTQDAARISVGSRTHPSWLRLALEIPVVVHQIQARVTGATIKGINIWDLKRIYIPTPTRAQQQRLAETAQRSVDRHEAIRSRVAQHRILLAERRQALIAAAVTGQFDVFTASGRNTTQGV